MLLGTSGAHVLRNMLTGEGIIRAGYGSEKSSIKYLQFNKGNWIVRAGYGSSIKDF